MPKLISSSAASTAARGNTQYKLRILGPSKSGGKKRTSAAERSGPKRVRSTHPQRQAACFLLAQLALAAAAMRARTAGLRVFFAAETCAEALLSCPAPAAWP